MNTITDKPIYKSGADSEKAKDGFITVKGKYHNYKTKEQVTPPLSSHGNQNNLSDGSDKAVYDEIGKIVSPILDKVAQEQIINQTLVGSRGSYSQFNPHNYRLYLDYKRPKSGFTQRLVRGWFEPLGSQNNGKEPVFMHKSGWKIVIKKTQAEVKKKHIERDWHLIDNGHTEEADRIMERKRKEGIAVFRQFVEEYGGETEYKLLNEYAIDNAVKNSLTKKVPINLHYETDVVKKCYKEEKHEYKKLIYAKNEMHNAGLHDFAPEIVLELQEIKKIIAKEPVTFSWLMENVKSVEEGMKYRRDTENLTFDERWELANKIRGDINFQWKRIEKVVL